MKELLFRALSWQLLENSGPLLINSSWVISLVQLVSVKYWKYSSKLPWQIFSSDCTQELRHLNLSPPPLRACLNVFSAFLHALSYLYLSMPLLIHPQSSSLTPTPSGWELRFLLCLRILQIDYFNPRNLRKGPLEFPRTGNILLWTIYLSYVVLQNYFKYTHTHTHTQIQLFWHVCGRLSWRPPKAVLLSW